MTVTDEPLLWGDLLRQMAPVAAASLVFLSVGTMLVWPAAALPQLLADDAGEGFTLSASQASWVVAAMHAGQLLGAAPGGFLAARLGRRRALLCSAPPMLLAWLATAFAAAPAPLLGARALGGAAVGVAFAAGPLYVAEAASARLRGAAGALPQLALSAGQLLAYCGGAWLSLRALALLAAALPAAFAAAFWAAPETPAWLLRRGRRAEAARALRALRGPRALQAALDAELLALEAFACAEAAEGVAAGTLSPFRSLVTEPAARRALWIVLALVGFQSFSGFTALLPYSTVIFEESGTSLDANHSGIVLGLIMVLMSLVSPVVVNAAGRRFCLLVSCAVAALSLLTEGAFFLAEERGAAVQRVDWLPVVALVAFFVAFTLGLGPLPTTVAGELFPAHVRGAAGTVASVAIGLGGFSAAKLYQIVTDAFGFYVTMWMFGGVCIGGVWFALVLLPETRGCSFEEIQRMLMGTVQHSDTLDKQAQSEVSSIHDTPHSGTPTNQRRVDCSGAEKGHGVAATVAECSAGAQHGMSRA